MEQRRLRAVLEHANDVLVVVDARGHVLFDLPQTVLGYGDVDMRGIDVFELVHPDDRDRAQAWMASLLDRPGLVGEHECRVLHADRSWRWMRVRAANRLADPDVHGVVVSALDVTRQREAEAHARQSDARLRSLVRNATDLTVVCDRRGVPRYATPSLEHMLGYTLEDIGIDRFHTEYVHPDDLPELIATFERMRDKEGEPAPVEMRVRRNDGAWRILQGHVTHLLHDPAVDGIVINVRDVTDAKEAEAALRRSEQRWKVLFANSSDLVNVFGAGGELVFSSDSGPILGWPWEMANDLAWIFDILHPDDKDVCADAFTRMLTTPGITGPVALRARHADGTWRWIESIANNLLDDPEVQGIVVHTRDITDRKRVEEQIRDQTRFVETLHGVGKTLAAELNLDRLTQAVTDAAVEVSGASFGVFVGGEELAVTASSGVRPPGHHFPSDLVALLLSGGGPMRADGVLAVPVTSGRGEVLGALLCGGPINGAFDDRGEAMLLGIAGHAAVALDNARLFHAAQIEIAARKQAEAELAHAATHDPLTGLPNRSLFLDRLAIALGRAERQHGAVGVLLFDLDRFKVVNDSLGHAAGDQLLVQVAARLEQIVRPGDTVARMGGDEFIMVCEDLNGEIDAIGIADRVAETLAAPFPLDEAEVTVAASVGIAVGAGEGHAPASLVRDADAAMYRAKERGRNRWELFDEGLRTRAVTRLTLENDLRRALEQDELRLHFQPIVSVTDGAVVGVEALVRWERQGLGLATPAEFIRVAEETGLVVPLGDWVLGETCRRLNQGLLDGISASINVSARQLQQSDMVATIQHALHKSSVDPRRLCIEITESVLMEDVESAVLMLEELRSLGITLWVDDFGTGYSSLAYLRRLPIDGLKIDRSFVAGLTKGAEDSAIAAGVVSLAHSLGMTALAEGVESDDQLAMLSDLGCDLAQGYRWAPPLPPTDLREWLAAH